MEQHIYKHRLELQINQVLTLPKGTKILAFQVQNAQLMIWTSTNPDAMEVQRRLAIAQTGHKTPQGIYVGTVQLDGFVWHLFDQGEEM